MTVVFGFDFLRLLVVVVVVPSAYPRREEGTSIIHKKHSWAYMYGLCIGLLSKQLPLSVYVNLNHTKHSKKLTEGSVGSSGTIRRFVLHR